MIETPDELSDWEKFARRHGVFGGTERAFREFLTDKEIYYDAIQLPRLEELYKEFKQKRKSS